MNLDCYFKREDERVNSRKNDLQSNGYKLRHSCVFFWFINYHIPVLAILKPYA